MEYVFKDNKHKALLTACYFITHPRKNEVTDKELNDWCVRKWKENAEEKKTCRKT